MNSIRTKLLCTILPALTVVWLICSGILYFGSRNFLYESLDQELSLLATDTPLLLGRAPERIRRRINNRSRLFDEGAEYYFEVWDSNKRSRNRSKSLAQQSMPYLGHLTKEKIYGFHKLPDGTPLRTVRYRISPPKSKKQRNGSHRRHLDIIIGKDRTVVEATLRELRHTIFLSTLIGLILAGLIVIWSIRQGLKPLTTLSHQLSRISSRNLDQRLQVKQNPQELQLMSEKVNDLLARLEDAFERERRFGSDLAHEIRTPTAEIRALAEVGLTWPEEFGKEELTNILQSSQRMETTTQAILDLTRIGTTSEMTEEEISLHDLTASLLPETPEMIVEGNATLTSHRAFLTIILQNLIGNAAAYAPAGDDIVIRLDSAFFSIENSAPELDQEDIPRMFERFWRKDKARSSSKHAGLGLRLASACAEKLGYRLEPTLRSQRLTITLHFEPSSTPPEQFSSSP